MKQRIGILGGTFDPIHYGHLAIAEDARTELCLDRVVFIPAAQQPLKQGRETAPALDRLAMVELACQGNSAFVVSKIEIDRAGVSYTVTTLEVLHHMYGGDLFFILGGDALADLPRWYQASRIPELAHLVAVGRPGAHVNTQQLMSVLPSLTGRLTHIAGPEIHLSSTIIRRRAAKGQSLRYLMPDPVVDYIASHRLYSTQVE